MGGVFGALGQTHPDPVYDRAMALSSYDLARRLHHEVPGIAIPESVQERPLAGGQAKEEGLRIVEELLSELSRRPEVAGAYIICPFNRYELALTVLEAVDCPSDRALNSGREARPRRIALVCRA